MMLSGRNACCHRFRTLTMLQQRKQIKFVWKTTTLSGTNATMTFMSSIDRTRFGIGILNFPITKSSNLSVQRRSLSVHDATEDEDDVGKEGCLSSSSSSSQNAAMILTKHLIDSSKSIVEEWHNIQKNQFEGASRFTSLVSLIEAWNQSFHEAEKRKDSIKLQEYVHILDQFAERLLHESRNNDTVSQLPSSTMFLLAAVHTCIVGWSKIAQMDEKAVVRAQELFLALDRYGSNIHFSFNRKDRFKTRRDLYRSVFLVLSRSKQKDPNSGQRACEWLEKMLKEEDDLINEKGNLTLDTMNYPLVTIEFFHWAMRACAVQGDVPNVVRLWKWLQSEHRTLAPTAVTFDCLIQAHQQRQQQQIRNDRDEITSPTVGQSTEALQQHGTCPTTSRSAAHVWERLLEAYRLHPSPSLIPIPSTLARVLSSTNKNDPTQTTTILYNALDFIEHYPEFSVAVNSNAFYIVLSHLTAMGRCDEASQVLQLLIHLYEKDRGNERLKPTLRHFTVLLYTYARCHEFEKASSLLQTIEESFAATSLNVQVYNRLMNVMLQSPPKNDYSVVTVIESIISRISHSQRLENSSHERQQNYLDIFPDTKSYTILMNAIIQSRQHDFHLRVDRILEQCRRLSSSTPHDNRVKPNAEMYATALLAWSQTYDPRAVLNAESIIELMKKEDIRDNNDRKLLQSRHYELLIAIYARAGKADQAEAVLRRMVHTVDNSPSSKNGLSNQNDCSPTAAAYAAVIQAWQKSKDPHERWPRAFAVFEAMLGRSRKSATRSQDVADAFVLAPKAHVMECLMRALSLNSKVPNKVRAVKSVLCKLKNEDSRAMLLDPNVTVAIIQALSGTVDNKQESWDLTISLLRTLGPNNANGEVYRVVLEACSRLVEVTEERDRVMENVFKQCANHGRVNPSVLQTLWRSCTPDLYTKLTLQDSRRRPNIGFIPDSWKRNNKPHF